tara:strand:+ start:127427 stop:127669 length:243 start_codon:yes stop_codon:yes gene_type:complete
MSKLVLSLLIATTILVNSGCMTTEGVDYIPSDKNDGYVSIKEHNFRIWLKNQKAIGGSEGFYGNDECPDAHGHGQMTPSN